MSHELHWYLSAGIWLVLAWAGAMQCMDAGLRYAREHPGQTGRLALRTALLSLLLVSAGLGLAVFENWLGVFNDLTVREIIAVTKIGVIGGVLTVMLLSYLDAQKKSP